MNREKAEALVKKINQYLESRLGDYHSEVSIVSRKADWTIYCEGPVINADDSLGIFKHIIQTYQTHVQIWINEKKGTFAARAGLNYTHYDGGSNGHDFNFTFTGELDGTEIKEIS